MKRFFLTLIFIGMLAIPVKSNETQQSATSVYICTGAYAKSYHIKPNCRGLSACKGQIKKVSLGEAQKQGRNACKICNK